MVYIYNPYNYDIRLSGSLISRVKDLMTQSEVLITDLFFNKLAPSKTKNQVKSLEESLRKVRLDSELQEFKADWKWVVSEYTRKQESKKIDAVYRKLMAKHSPTLINVEYHHFFADLGLNAGISSLWMPGVALIASHLAEKKGLKDLYVCANRKALIEKVKEVLDSPYDVRCALIAGSSGDGDDEPLHKFTFCIEKKNGETKIILLDSMASDYFSAPFLLEILKVCKDKGVKPEVFFSGEKREFAGYGCPVFALQDAVTFLQQKDFFQVIDFEKVKYYAGVEVKMVGALPPGFMIGTQSMKVLANYKAYEGIARFEEAIPGRKKNLKEYVERNKVNNNGADQNHYITRKLFQYKKFILGALRGLNDQEIQNLVYSTLLA